MKDQLCPCGKKSLDLLQPHYQLHAENNTGASLLHLVAALKVPVPILVEWCVSWQQDAALVQRPLHYAIQNPCLQSQTVKILLRYQPECARLAFPNGQSALVVALIGNQGCAAWNDGALQDLIMCYPDALMQHDVQSGYYHFQLAASLDTDVDILHGLLRLRPDLVAA